MCFASSFVVDVVVASSVVVDVVVASSVVVNFEMKQCSFFRTDPICTCPLKMLLKITNLASEIEDFAKT